MSGEANTGNHYFVISKDNNYVTLNDNSLYLLIEECNGLWESFLGYNQLPEHIYTNTLGIFISFSSAQGSKVLYYDYNNSSPIGWLSINNPESGDKIAVIPYDQGYKFSLKLSEMDFVYEDNETAFQLEEEAFFIFADSEGTSIWKSSKQARRETFYLYSAQGELLNQGTINYSEGREESGFWTVVKKNEQDEYIIFKNVYYDDYLEIVGFVF